MIFIAPQSPPTQQPLKPAIAVIDEFWNFRPGPERYWAEQIAKLLDDAKGEPVPLWQVIGAIVLQKDFENRDEYRAARREALHSVKVLTDSRRIARYHRNLYYSVSVWSPAPRSAIY